MCIYHVPHIIVSPVARVEYAESISRRNRDFPCHLWERELKDERMLERQSYHGEFFKSSSVVCDGRMSCDVIEDALITVAMSKEVEISV